jgi:hypothetical protein
MLFGSNRDFDLLVNINRELLQDIIEQEVGYYKLSLDDTQANIYGEALEKIYLDPVKLNCLITRGDQVIDVDEFGPDLGRNVSFAFIRRDLVDANTVPEVGDVVLWHEDYYEVDTVRENQLFIGRDKSYNIASYAGNYGSSVSIIVDCHLTRADKVGLTRVR